MNLLDNANSYISLLLERDHAGLDNDSDAQLEAMRNLVALYPNNPRAHVELGNVYRTNKDIASARMEYNKAIELAPGFGAVRKALALSLMFDEPTSNGRARWRANQYIDRSPDEADGYIVLGDVYRDANNLEEARNKYAQAIEVDSKNITGYSKRGHANTFLGDASAAEKDFAKAAELSKSFAGKANMQLFGSFSSLYSGDLDAGLAANAKMIEGLLKSDAADAEKTFPIMNAYWQRGQIALRHGKYDVAQAAFDERAKWAEKAVVQVGSPGFENGMKAGIAAWNGFVAARKGDLKTAKKLAEQNKTMLANDSNPRRYELYHQLIGAIEYESGNYESAAQHLSHADVDWILVKYETAMAHEKAGNSAEAMKLYQEVADWNFNSIFTALYKNDAKKKVGSASASTM
jgi:tetratricopeptide (TPR) repeat protein